ncbi:MAG TPA: aldo/keto reductase [Geobacteraceae bacterium]|nr:aldo/keto reductase [Geobacteraceae bacterium]
MLYRKLGKNGPDVSVLGFGCMRLPILDATGNATDIFDPGKAIDDEQATEMVEHAISSGINYFDTAYGYHGGQSESFLGKALKGKRERVLLATKLPVWLVQKPEDFDRLLDEQLARLDTSYLDYYLLHALGRRTWECMREIGITRMLDKARADGRIRRAGFSFHDDIRTFMEIVDAYQWDISQIQYNYFDRDFQAGREGLRYAAAKGIGMVVMEPLRGGRLTERIPEEIRTLWDQAPVRRTPAEWALRWVWDHSEVSMALSGMSNMSQLRENLRIAAEAEPGSLSGQELALVDKVTEIYKSKLKVNCTSCAYCLPCPHGVNIPMNFSLYNDTFMFKDADLSVMLYNHFIPADSRASACTACGACEERCPQHIRIVEELKKVHAHLAKEEPSGNDEIEG